MRIGFLAGEGARRGNFHLELAVLAGNQRVVTVLSRQLGEVRRLHHLMPRAEPHIISRIELAAHALGHRAGLSEDAHADPRRR